MHVFIHYVFLGINTWRERRHVCIFAFVCMRCVHRLGLCRPTYVRVGVCMCILCVNVGILIIDVKVDSKKNNLDDKYTQLKQMKKFSSKITPLVCVTTFELWLLVEYKLKTMYWVLDHKKRSKNALKMR